MPDLKAAGTDDLHIKIGKEVDISVPAGVVHDAVGVWEFTLNWYASNPLQGGSVLLTFILVVLIFRRTRRETVTMDQEYRDKIEATKQPELALPPPAKK